MKKDLLFQNPNPDEPFREPIAKLSRMLSDRTSVRLGLEKITKNSPEYIGLSVLCTDEMAEVAQKMGQRIPRTLSEMQTLTGMERSHLEELLAQMAINGLIEYNWENPRREKQYVLPLFVPGIAEFTNMNRDLLEAHPEMGRFFERMSVLPVQGVTQLIPPGGAGIGMHVIPVEKAITLENESVSIEHISYWLDKYEGKYAASPCSCRRARKTFDEGCADDPEGWCIAIGDMADYIVETNKGGRYIDRQEVLDILKQAEDNGFVHQITNIDGENKIFAICNCNVNVCFALRTSQLFNTPNMSRSAYVARVTRENCTACGQCVEHCPAGAVKLGRRLCQKDGCEVVYARQPLPSEVPWGKKMLSEDYRDKNRISCYPGGTSPCKSRCPAHIAVQGYIKLASMERFQEALALIKKENPFPAVCGRICARPCEDACTRGKLDGAVAIDEVKKFIAGQDLDAKTRFIPPKVVPSLSGSFKEKIAIIGAGCAGLTCAYFLAQKGYHPVVFEKNKCPGGMLRYGIPSYKLEKDVVEAEIEVIQAMGVTIQTSVEVGRDVTIPQLRREGYQAFFVAIGCQGGRSAGVPGQESEGVVSAVDFLREVNEGTLLHLSQSVVVIGGGNVAMDAAGCALALGAGRVSVYCLEEREHMPASEEEVEEITDKGAVLVCGFGPKEVLSENGHVTGIVLKRCLTTLDREGRFHPVYDEEDTLSVPCSHVILAIGQRILWNDLLEGSAVELGQGDRPVADALTLQTKEPDIFVGGDVYTGPGFAIDAIAQGKEAAISIHRFVQPGSSLTIGRDLRDIPMLDREDVQIKGYDLTRRQVPQRKEQKTPFQDPRATFTKDQVLLETRRCLSCGVSVVDENRCIGCGICTTKCAFDAIHLYREHPECSHMIKSEDKMKEIVPYAAKQLLRVHVTRRKKAASALQTSAKDQESLKKG